MEVAASLQPKAASVTLIGRSGVPFENILGREVGNAIRKLFESKGIVFHVNVSVSEFKGEAGILKHAVLSDGQILPANVCVLGLGMTTLTSSSFPHIRFSCSDYFRI